jgi:hypothetical protein
VSLWYQAPQSTFEPRDSRSIGWSQVPNRRAVLLDDDIQSPQHSTGGGTQIDLSNTMSFGGPKINNSVSVSVGGAGGMGIQLDPTINFAQFGFQNFQDMTFEQYQMISNQFFSEVLNQVQNIYTIVGSFSSGITTAVTVITGAALVGSNLQFSTTVLNFTGGLITSTSSGSAINIATTTCT